MDTPTVSSACSRKSFFAKLGGLLAAAGLAPGLLGKLNAAPTRAPAATPVNLRPEPRAVPRRD